MKRDENERKRKNRKTDKDVVKEIERKERKERGRRCRRNTNRAPEGRDKKGEDEETNGGRERQQRRETYLS